MDLSAKEHTLTIDLETALTGLIKLIKALSFYPPGHPALAKAAEETATAFQPLLERHDTCPYHVTQKGFSLDAIPLAPNNKYLASLALKLLERRVRHLLFLPELTDHELLAFAEELTKSAAQLLAEGGLPKRLADRQIRSIWINETDLQVIQNNLREFENGQPKNLAGETGQKPRWETAETSVVVTRMQDFLEELKEPLNDHEYAQLLQKIRHIAREFLRQTGLNGCLALLGLLETHRQESQRSSSQRDAATAAIGSLLTAEIRDLLVDCVAEKTLKASQQRALSRLLVGLGLKIATPLLKRMNAERNTITRRHYTAILAAMGECIFELLQTEIANKTWYVVRNAVTVLGESQLESALPLLNKTITHPEVRVRRVLIRALGAIGSSSVIPLLLRLSQDKNAELHQPAIMALGALKNPKALPPLVSILKEFDFGGKKTELKTATIQALAATKSPQAIIPLLKFARRRNVFKRKHIEGLRAEAIMALGQLGNDQLLPLLTQIPNAHKGPVGKALKQATAQLQKHHHVS
ncbi:MAG: HEAT repeat domain-containing protein [Chloroflexi bacterium]|nr:HEAT repeat domain-containing protein [Chloroflexota bacterium]